MVAASGNSGWIIAFSFAGALVLSSCFSSTSSELHHEVISKSKATEPSWTKQKRETLIRNSPNYEYVTRNSEVSNLPLGIKATQLQAMENSRTAFIDLLRDEATKDVSSATSKSLKQHEQFNLAIEDLVKRRYAEEAKVADIYFEQYLDGGKAGPSAGQALYKVYVLVAVRSELVPRLIQELGNKFKDSIDPSLKAVGSTIQARFPVSAGS